MAQNESDKEEMLKLIIDQNLQIRKMEEQIEELLKEKSSLQANTDPTLATQTSYEGAKPSATLNITDASQMAQDLTT